MFFIMLVIVIFVVVCASKSRSDNTNTPMPEKTPAQPKPVKPFDESDPLQIIHLTYALSTVIACMSRSRMYVVMQNENPDKGWPQVIKISAYIYDFDKDFPDQNFAHFTKWGLSETDAQYLASVPFDIRGRDVTYTFKSTLPHIPSSLKHQVTEAMERGIQRSKLVALGSMTYTIDTSREQSVACSVK